MTTSIVSQQTYLRAGRGQWLAAAFLLLFPLFYGCLALGLGQDANWDFRNYHWYNGYAYWTGRGSVDMLVSQTPNFYNPTLDVPYYLLATHVSAMVAGFILACVQGLNFVFLYFLAQRCLIIANAERKVLACAAIAAMGMLGAGGIAQIGATFYDNVTSLGLFASALLVALKIDSFPTMSWRRLALWALLAGVPAGVMMGLKLPSVVFCVGLCGALLFVPVSFQRRFGLAFFFGLGVLAGLALSFGHWGWFLQTHYGNPFFPYFNQIFKSPLAPLTSARDIQFMPHGLSEFLLYPYLFGASPFRVGEIPWRDWRIPALYTLLPMLFAVRIYLRIQHEAPPRGDMAAPVASRYLLCVGALSYGVWLVMFSIYRYAVPLEMLAPLLLVLTIGRFPLSLRARTWIAATLLVGLAVTVQGGNWGRKDEWLDHAVEIERPELGDVSKTMMLMAGLEPYAHVLSEFPPEMPIVRIDSNFARAYEDKGINKLLHERVSSHLADGGKLMLLIPSWQHKIGLTALKYYDLTFKPQTCQTIDDHLYQKLDLCSVEPATKRRKLR